MSTVEASITKLAHSSMVLSSNSEIISFLLYILIQVGELSENVNVGRIARFYGLPQSKAKVVRDHTISLLPQPAAT